jgi:hypothetical protein
MILLGLAYALIEGGPAHPDAVLHAVVIALVMRWDRQAWDDRHRLALAGGRC